MSDDRSNKNQEEKPPQPKFYSKEEREMRLFLKFKSSIATSLENLNIKNLLDLRENNNESFLTDDNVSVTSSKVFGNNKGLQNSVKLPFIIGTNEFFSNEYLGVGNDYNLSGIIDRNMNMVHKKTSTSNIGGDNHNILVEKEYDLIPVNFIIDYINRTPIKLILNLLTKSKPQRILIFLR